MRQPFRGYAQLKAPNQTLELHVDINRLVDLQEATGMPLGLMLAALQQVDMRVFRAVFHICALKHHPKLTEEEVGEIMSDVGLDEMEAALTQLFKAVMPEKKGKDKNPRKPAGKK